MRLVTLLLRVHFPGWHLPGGLAVPAQAAAGDGWLQQLGRAILLRKGDFRCTMLVSPCQQHLWHRWLLPPSLCRSRRHTAVARFAAACIHMQGSHAAPACPACWLLRQIYKGGMHMHNLLTLT